jgi:serine/threonine protein kinase
MEDRPSSRGIQRTSRYRVGRASDIWSLGCILYQMQYGRTPFAHIKNQMHKLSCIRDPTYEISYPPEAAASPNLLDVLRGCLQRDPDKRMGMVALLDHPYVSQEGSYSRRMTAPSVRDNIRATLQVLADRGHASLVAHHEAESFERAVQDKIRYESNVEKSSGRGIVGASGGSRGGGGLSISRMTPTASAITAQGHSMRQ